MTASEPGAAARVRPLARPAAGTQAEVAESATPAALTSSAGSSEQPSFVDTGLVRSRVGQLGGEIEAMGPTAREVVLPVAVARSYVHSGLDGLRSGGGKKAASGWGGGRNLGMTARAVPGRGLGQWAPCRPARVSLGTELGAERAWQRCMRFKAHTALGEAQHTACALRSGATTARRGAARHHCMLPLHATCPS